MSPVWGVVATFGLMAVADLLRAARGLVREERLAALDEDDRREREAVRLAAQKGRMGFRTKG